MNKYLQKKLELKTQLCVPFLHDKSCLKEESRNNMNNVSDI